ncbi:MAG TPA: hypothetical protein VL728_11010 [Cyclobacteriaceae bacterium]|jgi:hypothetical protein|nr:hypothetical protein [Cyclobacteriaceae bacterium]
MIDVLAEPWPLAKKIIFRFAFVYFGLFIVVNNYEAYPFWEYVSEPFADLSHKFIPWIGKNILRLPREITEFTAGSSDTTYDYVVLLMIFLAAILSAIAWSILDRRSGNYSKLYYWFTLFIRFYVGLLLINYGLYKLFKVQFPYPNIYRLNQTYGSSSPMSLAWTFLGFSYGYNLFMGVAEVAAVLLLFRRTLTFGAIITLMTTLNVTAINYFYDVPVKILSTHLVLMTFMLLLHDRDALWKFFFSGESARLSIIKRPDFSRRSRIVGLLLKGLIIAYAFVAHSIQCISDMKAYGMLAPKGKLFGVYQVKSFQFGSDTLGQNAMRWKAMYIQQDTYAKIETTNDSTAWYKLELDSINHSIRFKNPNDTSEAYHFRYSLSSQNIFSLRGTVKEDSIRILFQRVNEENAYNLTDRGFHWINETPYMR